MAENKNRGDTNVKQKIQKTKVKVKIVQQKKTASKRGSRIQSYEAQAQAQTQQR
jgi:hypothetical protein